MRRRGKNVPIMALHEAEPAAPRKPHSSYHVHRTMADTSPEKEPKKPTLSNCTLCPGICEAADFGSRGDGSVQVLLVKLNILRSRKVITD